MITTKSNHKNSLFRRRTLFDPNHFFGSVLLGIVSGIVGGVVVAAASRISMRAVALLAGGPTSFSIDGTLNILFFGTLFGALAGLLYGFILPFLPGSIIQRGVVFGGMLALLATGVIVVFQAEGELALVSKWAIFGLFVPLLLLYGFVLGSVAARLFRGEANLLGESGRFARTAARITLAAALVNAIIELTLVITYPAVSNLGYDLSVFLDNAAGATLLLMAAAGTVGLLRSGATGSSAVAKYGLGLALVIYVLLGLNAVSEGLNMIELHGLVRLIARLEFDENLTMLLIFFLVGLLGLLVAGIVAVRARRWQAWRRYSPLLVGLFPFMSLLFLHPALFPGLVGMSLSGRNLLAHGIAALFALCWLILGIALRTESGQTQPDLSAPAR